MNIKALMLAAVSIVLAAATFFILRAIAPQRHVEQERVMTGPTVDQVFAGQLALAEIEDSAPPPTAPPPPPAEELMPSEEMASPDSAGIDSAGTDAAGDGDIDTGLDAAAPETEAAMPSEQPEPAEPVSAPAPVTAAAPAAAPAAATAPAASEAPAPKPSKPRSSKPAKAVNWWGAESPTGLSLVYAGSAAYRKAVVLMFNGSFNAADAVNGSVKVTDASGKTVSGSWELSEKNPRMLVFPVKKGGTYKVVVNSGLKDRNNRALEKTLQGPVTVN
jgi:hypothetical protein